VQGETIEQQFGNSQSALNTLDLYTSAVLRATLEEGYNPPPEFRKQIQELSDTSCRVYRSHVHESDDFFRRATSHTTTELTLCRAAILTQHDALASYNDAMACMRNTRPLCRIVCL
jgi:phosphoenolpyruvate carboxylase